MADKLAIIERVIREHQLIRENVRLVDGSMNDVQAALNLQQAYSGWTLTSTEAMTAKQKELGETIGRLEFGLDRHFAFEEDALPALLGDLLMRALLEEHRQIRQGLVGVKSLLAGTPLPGLTQEKLLQAKSQIQASIGNFGQALEEHAAREEVILNMVKKALQPKG